MQQQKYQKKPYSKPYRPKPARILSKKERLALQLKGLRTMFLFFFVLFILNIVFRGFVMDAILAILFLCVLCSIGMIFLTQKMLQNTSKESWSYMPLDALRRLDPFQFEEYVAWVYRRLGYNNVRITPQMGDGGIDILMEKNGIKYGVQVKRYAADHYVQVDEVRAVIGSREQLHLDKVIFVTTSSYTRFVWDNIRRDNITLVDGRKLDEMARGL